MKVKGNADKTISRGRVLWDGKNLSCVQGSGEYIARENMGFSFEKIAMRDKQRDLKYQPVNRENV